MGKKILFALSLLRYKDFNRISEYKNDLYGPIWIFATIVFTICVSQNFYSYLIRPAGQKFEYSISFLPNAFMIVYVFGFMVPVCFSMIIKAFGGAIRVL